MDSLGQLRKLSRGNVELQRAAWICYTWWSAGVVMDHWMSCEPSKNGCTALMQAVPVWAELVLRSMGNVQDLCGFLLIGAMQDSHDNAVGTALTARELVVGGMHL